ncbi:MAG: AAA family ATPase [Enterocloster asparagiformis]|nr:AAA family ATPase [Enterocloster asparagiformis]
MEKKATIIAVTGKGGVGKTSIAAIIVKVLRDMKPQARILAIDADPAVGLSTALGIEVPKTIDDIRKSFIDKAEAGETRQAIELLNDAQYEILEALVEADGFNFIAVGRPEAAGCYCKVNGYLKDIISILSEKFDYVMIDGEAGVEQVNRRVMEQVSHLLLVSDPSKKGRQVIQSIKQVADHLVMYDKVGAVINRVREDSPIELLDTGDIPVLAYIEEDKNLNRFDIEGKSVFELPKDSPIELEVKKALKEFRILQEESR